MRGLTTQPARLFAVAPIEGETRLICGVEATYKRGAYSAAVLVGDEAVTVSALETCTGAVVGLLYTAHWRDGGVSVVGVGATIEDAADDARMRFLGHVLAAAVSS